MPEGLPSPGLGTLIALLLFIAGSVWLGAMAQRAVQRGSFLKGYFLGHRGLGSWALALTATVQSGGTFMGFPSLVYSHGWVVALWIAGYMVVPITGFGVLGKRIAHLSRRSGAITVPDLFRERFGDPAIGLVSSLFIMFFMCFMMVAQFKAGALVMKIAWPGTGVLALSEESAPYQLTGRSLDRLREHGVPQEVVSRLAPLEGSGFQTPAEVERSLGSVLTPQEWREFGRAVVHETEQTDWLYYLGLAIFTLTVVGYTLIGGFLAAVWTDLFQSVMMLIGVMILLPLALSAAGGMEPATLAAVEQTGPGFVFGPGYSPDGRQFHTLGLAFSFFFTWVFAGLGSPAGMVRIMACKDTQTIRRSIFLLNAYNACIYIPLVMICVCGRAIIPELPSGKSDEIIPRLALSTTSVLPGGSFVAGIILAAPFGAVMATVSSYLVVIASGLVRDVYQRFLNPQANDTEIKRLSYLVMVLVGAVAVGANLRPVAYLQAIVVFSGTSAAATFVTPALMAAFWRRATAAGAKAAMVVGAGTMLALFAAGWMGTDPMIGQATRFRPYYLMGLDPIVWGLAASAVAGILVSFLTRPPSPALVSRFFDASPPMKHEG